MTQWKEIGGNTAVQDDRETIYPKYKELFEAGVPEDGLVIAEGLFTGSYESVNNFDPNKTDITFYVDAGEKKIGLNGSGNLKYLMDKAALTPNVSKIQVVYMGKEKINKGPFQGRLSHTFKLNVAESN